MFPIFGQEVGTAAPSTPVRRPAGDPGEAEGFKLRRIGLGPREKEVWWMTNGQESCEM